MHSGVVGVVGVGVAGVVVGDVVAGVVDGVVVGGVGVVVGVGCCFRHYCYLYSNNGYFICLRSGGGSYRRLFNNASSPLSRIEAEIFRSREAPPSYNAAMGITDP